jgi:Tol biopolymer transport system component
MAGNFVEPVFLIDYTRPAQVSDYRSVVDATASTVIFERGDAATPLLTSLFSLDITSSGNAPMPFLQGPALPFTASRPDWSWVNDNIAFTGQAVEGNDYYVGLADGGGIFRLLESTLGMIYPAWFPDGETLAVYNESQTATPKPNTTTITMFGEVLKYAVEGSTLYAGMQSVNQASPNLIAFAGQPTANGAYNQDYNYIWILDTSTGESKPMEPGCPTSGPFQAAYQGRAPWWSPDGNWVAFESNRSGSGYSIYLFDYTIGGPAVQITDPSYNMNHAKWFPTGFPGGPAGNPSLVVAAFQNGANGGPPALPYGIATLNVSPWVSPSR